MLINCPECKREISDKAVACPHCGYPIAGSTTTIDEANALYTAVLADYGREKIRVIKVVMELTGKGLAEAKSFVESANPIIASHLSKADAESIKSSFASVGAIVELRDERSGNVATTDTVRCPRCGSSQIQVVQKKDFSFGKAAFGTVLFGSIGSSAGLLGTGKTERVCVNCGHRF